MKLTNKEILELVEKAKKNKKDYVHITNKESLTLDDKLKMALCKHFVRYMNEKKIKTSDLAHILKIPQSRVSEIVHYKIRKFSLEKLMDNLEKLANHSPRIREYLSMFEEIAELPVNKVKIIDIRILTKNIKDLGSEFKFA